MTVIAARGTTFSRHNGTTYDIAGQVKNISGPAMSQDVIDTTHLTSTSAFRTFIAGFRDAGEVTVEIEFDPDDAVVHTALRNDLVTGASTLYKITFSDPTPATAIFTALVTAFDHSASLEDVLMASVTLKLTGTVAFA